VSVIFEKMALLGLGLIGSSISHAARRGGLVKTISGYARSAETRDIAKEIGIIDTAHATAADAVKDADLIILCTPVGTYGALAKEIAPHLKAGSTLTDVGSVKGAVVRDVAPHLPLNVHFIPSHPIAGTEQSGPRAGFATLFDNRWFIITPTPHSDATAVAKLKQFWEGLGANVDEMTPEHHDLVLAITSHLPHLIAYNTVATASDLEDVTKGEVIKYSASGFRDFTRIAASDPTMWRDIFLNNKEAVLEMLGRFSEELSVLQRAIRWGDGETLFDLFTRARDIRRGIIQAGQDTAAPDFGRSPAHKT
jgi:cyclohexadieny/prephenate dehydrogenase